MKRYSLISALLAGLLPSTLDIAKLSKYDLWFDLVSYAEPRMPQIEDYGEDSSSISKNQGIV